MSFQQDLYLEDLINYWREHASDRASDVIRAAKTVNESMVESGGWFSGDSYNTTIADLQEMDSVFASQGKEGLDSRIALHAMLGHEMTVSNGEIVFSAMRQADVDTFNGILKNAKDYQSFEHAQPYEGYALVAANVSNAQGGVECLTKSEAVAKQALEFGKKLQGAIIDRAQAIDVAAGSEVSPGNCIPTEKWADQRGKTDNGREI